MKKLLVALVALTTVSAFAGTDNMIRFYGFENGGNSKSFDVSMDSDDAKEADKGQNIAINYARAFNQFQVGITYRSSQDGDNSAATDDNKGTTTGLSFYYNMESSIDNTCYLALHYLMHATSSGTVTHNELTQGLGEDDTATTIALEYGHRWNVGSAWGFNLTYAPSITYNMNSYKWDVSTKDDSVGKSETSLAWNWIKFDVLF